MGVVYRGEVKAISAIKTQSLARPFPSCVFIFYIIYISNQHFSETWFKSGLYIFMLITTSQFKESFFWGEHQRLHAHSTVASGIIIIIKILVGARLLSLPCNKSYSAISQYFSSYNCSPDVSNKHTNVIHKGDL